MRSIRWIAVLVAGVVSIPGAVVAAPDLVGDEVTLQVADGAGLAAPQTVVAADGTLWTVWGDDVAGIGARAFAPDLTAVAPGTTVAPNRLPEAVPYRGPALVREGATTVPLADGRLFVVWREQRIELTADIFYQRSEVESSAIAGRLIGPSGQPASRIFTLVERAGETLGMPEALAVADRRVVVAWAETSADGAPAGIRARIVAPNGRALTGELVVDGIEDRGDGAHPALAPAADGGFLAAWQRPGEAGLAVRTFDADGLPTGPAAAVVDRGATLPVVTRGADGGYLVAWVGAVTEPGAGDLEHRVYGRSLDLQGVPVGPVQALSSGGGRAHGSPALVAAADGYLAAWTVWGQNFPQSVRAVSLDSLGRVDGESVRLSEGAVNFQWSLGLAAAPDGRYVASWVGYDGDGHRAVNGRVLATSGAPRTACLAVAGSGACAH